MRSVVNDAGITRLILIRGGASKVSVTAATSVTTSGRGGINVDWYSFGCGLAMTYAWVTLAYGEYIENLTCVVIE